MLQILGVRQLSVRDIVDLHILPAFQSDQALALSPLTAVSYLSLVVASGLLPEGHGGRKPSAGQLALLETLKQHAVLSTNKGLVKADTPYLHFHPSLLLTQHIKQKASIFVP